jgi:hypothetical protein
MTDGLDSVAVGIPEKRRVIGGVIIARTGRAIIAAAGMLSRHPDASTWVRHFALKHQ